MSGTFGGSSLSASTPPSQKAAERPITFVLEADGRSVAEVTLGIRPEDFSRSDPSRVTVHHTLGGAWADNFGPGLASIQISGTTGWRGGADGNGEERWRRLRDTVFDAWHKRRADAIKAGRDPATIKLLYADALSGFVSEVAPLSMTLRRSRSRPLLIQYSIAMTVLDENEDQLRYLRGGAARGAFGAVGGVFESVMGALRTIRNAIKTANQWVQANLVQPVRSFLGMANAVFNETVAMTRDVQDLSGSLLSIPTMIASTGLNAFRAYAAIANLPANVRHQAMQTAGAFLNVFCFLTRARSRRKTYVDYSDLYGASGCSSISGGRPVSPLAGRNAFAAVPAQPSVPGLAVSPAATQSLRTMSSADPVLRPMQPATIGQHLSTINSGVTYIPRAAAA